MEIPETEELAGSSQSSPCSMHEYAEQLRLWLNQAYQWQTASYFMPLALMGQFSPPPLVPPRTGMTAEQQPTPTVQPQQQQQTENTNNNRNDANVPPVPGMVYEIPQLTRRIAAELIDFGILFLMKAIITIAVLDNWDLIDADLLDADNFENVDEYDYAVTLTTKLLPIEIIHRFLVIGYEVWFTMKNGCTPGKKIMGIKTVQCTKAIPIGENRVLVEPATEPGFWRITGRAIVKNMGTILLFPTFLPFLIVQNNRTLYDVLCGTIVVVEH